MSGQPWSAQVLTLFPEMFPGPLGSSLAGRALERRIWTLETVDIRSFARDKHRSVDDTPCGGGPGMVMRPDVLAAAIDGTVGDGTVGDGTVGTVGLSGRPLIYMSPRGRPMDQAFVREMASGPGVVVVCGRFEGVDERVLEARGMLEISLGDFVLSGGEISAMALLDAAVRLLPGVMGDTESMAEESFAGGLLEYPQYTRPPVWEGRAVPPVLLSGHHEAIRAWRRAEAERITRARRPDLWQAYAAAGRTPETSEGKVKP